tara:strand:+ start:267 stop:1001 length:735 start_codon:yes stop_codon:yes gene_type:complete
MFYKTNQIEFTAPKIIVDHCKEFYPEPALINTPEWYKKLKHDKDRKTIKGCIPFLDALTAGYILKVATDLIIKRKGDVSEVKYAVNQGSLFPPLNINTVKNHTDHPHYQLGESPMIDKNSFPAFLKIYNPWIIKTPPGYSCLFTAPMNNKEDRFEAIAGIVDTDLFPGQINFPIVLNGDKYRGDFEHLVKKGTPIAQCIPFKREEWKMKITADDGYDIDKFLNIWNTSFVNSYKEKIWRKKKWR